MEKEIISQLVSKRNYKNIEKLIWKTYCGLHIKYSKSRTTKLRILLLCNPCNGFGDVVFAIKLMTYIKDWYGCAVKIGTTTPEMFEKLGVKDSDIISLGVKSVSQCRRFRYLNASNLKTQKPFNLILVAPLIADSSIIQSDITAIVPYADKFNTFFFSEYNDILTKGFDFNTGVGNGRDGVFLTRVVKSTNSFKKLGMYALAYIAETIAGSEMCFMNFVGMVTEKYSSKSFSIVAPNWIGELDHNLFLKNVRGNYKTILLYTKNGIAEIENNGGDTLHIRCDILPVPNAEMLVLMQHSVDDILLTGDQSITDALSCCSSKNIFYQIAPWKTNLGRNLTKYLPNEFLKTKKTACGSVSAIHYKSNYTGFIKQWDFRVLGKIKLDALMAYAIDMRANAWIIDAIKGSRTMKSLKNKLLNFL